MHKRLVYSCMCIDPLIVFQQFVNLTNDNSLYILCRDVETNIHLFINSFIH